MLPNVGLAISRLRAPRESHVAKAPSRAALAAALNPPASGRVRRGIRQIVSLLAVTPLVSLVVVVPGNMTTFQSFLGQQAV